MEKGASNPQLFGIIDTNAHQFDALSKSGAYTYIPLLHYTFLRVLAPKMHAFLEKYMIRNTPSAMALIIAVLLLTGCATTVVTSSWKDAGYLKQPHKTLVVAILRKKEYRIALEDEFAHQLNEKGLDVTTGSKTFPESTPGDKAELESYLRSHGYDSFLLVRIVAWKDLLANNPGSEPNWPDSYSMDKDIDSLPKNGVEERIAMAEANLYDAATGKLFWTAATQTPIEEINHDLMADYVAQIIKRMQRNGLVR